MAAGMLLGLSGCGSGGKSASGLSTTHISRKHASGSAATPGEVPLAEMVSAVSASKANASVELKFLLPSRPEVGQVMDLDVAVVPRPPVPDSVSVTFQVSDGLEVVDGVQIDSDEKLVAGNPIRHVVKILPKRDGIFALTAVVSFAVQNQNLSRTFSIPVIAGEGMQEQVAKEP